MSDGQAIEIEPFRAVVVGAGGVGGWLTRGLVRMLKYRAPGSALIIVDGDSYEPKNQERQLFKSLGNKAEVMAFELTEEFPDVPIAPVPSWVVPSLTDVFEEEAKREEEENVTKVVAKEFFKDGDVIYLVVDNFAARRTIIDAAAELDNIDVFMGGNDEDLFGSVYHYKRREGRDVTINPVSTHPELQNPEDRNPGEMSCEERAEIDGGTQVIPANMAVASWLLALTQVSLLEEGHEITGQYYFDLREGGASTLDALVEHDSDVLVGS